ncbi:hypothetical protein PMG11_06447 [Penicillium brasilianum]|uniref:Carboxylic ester hydrolase n=1 Tax=Penicillium brasilianum TaxID=104259 RepID=A0A0F7TPI8_PENBI|nr:hypothetical protein PMG11_06447 [Penicillium brasilianum]
MGWNFRTYSLVLLALSLSPASLANPIHTASLVVDLGYAKYRGAYDGAYDINIFKGIRYAAPPVGKLRWQAPQPPSVNRTAVISATKQPPLCPQSGAAELPAVYGFNSALGDEDCLFLNVFAPAGAEDLPILVWIHGGGYGLFGATYDPSDWMKTNENGFISVMIQYRLGAFGFLSSDAVHRYGKANAGLLDMRFALEWVQQHIAKFGGDPSRVTIGGESSGAGAAMLQAMAYGGRENGLFNNIIAASPYTATQFEYNDDIPTIHYHDFAARVGCYEDMSSSEHSIFECLVRANTEELQYASANISTSGAWGTWAFLPVIDGEFVQDLPSRQLLEKRVSGKRMLSGNNANDGVPLSPPTLNSTAAFMQYLKSAFPRLTPTVPSSSPESTSPLYDTLGNRAPTALNQSEFATGLQQTAFNIFAETAFDCPSYWLADAFSPGASEEPMKGKGSWKYQYSVTPAYHGADLTAYFSVGASVPNAGYRDAFQRILGSFIINDSPIISVSDAKGGMANATVPEGRNGDIDWPQWKEDSPMLMDLNTTGGTLVRQIVTDHLAYWLREGSGIINEFRLVDARAWEGGRGERCEFWQKVGSRVPQ